MSGEGALRAGVNLLWCRPGRVGGAEEYLVRQLYGVREADPPIELRLAITSEFARAHHGLVAGSDVAIAASIANHVAGRVIEEVRWLPGQTRDLDLIHHGNASVPLRSPQPTVLTIHDLQYREYPEYFSPARLAYLRWTVPRSVARAAIICTPSEFVRSTVIDAFGAPPDAVFVVPHGVPRTTQPPTTPDDLRSRYRLGSRRVILYPAATYPHKRHDFLLDLMEREITGEDFVLVLTGGQARSERKLNAAIADRRLGRRVLRLGRLPRPDLDGLLGMASVVVFPSEYEGFGAPVIEAMLAGTPVVCSDRAALPEVAGDAAEVTPLNLEAWGEAVRRVISSPVGLVAKGTERAASFTTQASGRALAAAYRAAVNR